jgi:hypothetical protein
MGAMGEFGDEWPFLRPVPLLCRLFGHRWKPSYIGEVIRRQPRWVYINHYCTRCYVTSVILPPPSIEVADDRPPTVSDAPAD